MPVARRSHRRLARVLVGTLLLLENRLLAATVRLIAVVIVLRCCRHGVRRHTSARAVEIVISEVYNCFAGLVYLMILIGPEEVRSADKVRWILNVVHDVRVDVVDVEINVLVASAAAAATADRAQLLSDVADKVAALLAACRCARGRRPGIKQTIVVREENVVVAVVDVDLSLRQILILARI